MSRQCLLSGAPLLRVACAALALIVAHAPSAEALSLALADGRVVEMNKPSASTRIVGAAQVWVLQSYAISADCRPPPGCYAKSQLINYDFSCTPRYAVVAERISMDLNGNVVKHEVMEPGATVTLDYFTGGDLLESFCGPLPDPADLRDRMTPDLGTKPGKR